MSSEVGSSGPAGRAGAAGVSKTSRVAGETRSIVIVALQLILALAVVHQFQLESRTFFHVMALGAAGFVVHALLPLQYRLPFFAVLSLAAILVALGPFDGLSLIVLGLGLIGICHLPIGLLYRVLLLLVAGGLFAFWRMEWLPAPWSVAIWPLLASMFMFRLALYLHSLRHDKHRPTAARTLAYFFMLPNVCFPLFPVVDYSTFVRTYFDRDASLIYYSGIKWIARGLLHLILYRFVYLHLASDPAGLRTLGDLVQFLLATFLLYLRVSGQFHLIVGMLHLFGFRLPDTHHLYYLASSFTDFWRRINIYWKDFMMKLVYYPSYFRLRRFGNTFGLVVATLAVFIATWLLHSYQWFWLRGGFPLEPQDALFWGILAVLVVMGSLREIKRPSKRTPRGGPTWSLSLALRTLRTFVAICVLWSLWSAESVIEWLMMWPVATNAEQRDLLVLLGLVVGFIAIAGHNWSAWESYGGTQKVFYRRSEFRSGAVLLGVLLIGNTGLYDRVSPPLGALVGSLQGSTLNARDATLQHKGYYENLDNASRMSLQLWSVEAQKPKHWVGLSQTQAYRQTEGLVTGELVPNARITFLDQPLSVNSLGMRDRERTIEKPAGTFRIALLGPSHVMGSGVADDDTFSRLLEDRINLARPAGPEVRFEVLNFGIAAATLLDQYAILTQRVAEFRPDVVIVTDSPRGKEAVIGTALSYASRGINAPYPELDALLDDTGVRQLDDDGVPIPFDVGRSIARALGVPARMPWTEADRRLRRVNDDILRSAFVAIDTRARADGAVPVFLALDNVEGPPSSKVRALDDATSTGLLVFDLLDLWAGKDQSTLIIAPWDRHPNAAGNQLIADRLVALIEQHATELGIPSKQRRETAISE